MQFSPMTPMSSSPQPMAGHPAAATPTSQATGGPAVPGGSGVVIFLFCYWF